MLTLDDLCAHLLPPDDHIQFQSLIIDQQFPLMPYDSYTTYAGEVS